MKKRIERNLSKWLWGKAKTYDQLLRMYLTSGRQRDQDTITAFQQLYWNAGKLGGTWNDTKWMGIEVLKYPTDLHIYQEIIHEVRPTLLIETGTNMGGSSLYYAHMFDILGQGQIFTIDVVEYETRPIHPRIEYFVGSSIEDKTVAEVAKRTAKSEIVMVVLDSCHDKAHVLREMEIYGEFVTPGSYMVVEDTALCGNPVGEVGHLGAKAAVEEYVKRKGCQFIVDKTRHKFLLSMNTGGYLRKVIP